MLIVLFGCEQCTPPMASNLSLIALGVLTILAVAVVFALRSGLKH